jgi:hypothetical protein
MDNDLRPNPVDHEPRRITDPREFEKNLDLAKNKIAIEPGTLVFIISVVLLLPLILTGLFAH